MFNSAVQLTFPCPACGGFVTLRTFRASGPCPACNTHLEVNLQVRTGAATTVQQLYPEGDPGGGKKFDERRFRPAVQPPQ